MASDNHFCERIRYSTGSVWAWVSGSALLGAVLGSALSALVYNSYNRPLSSFRGITGLICDIFSFHSKPLEMCLGILLYWGYSL
jgi:hypothetical protein